MKEESTVSFPVCKAMCLLALAYVVLWALLPSIFWQGMYLDSSENIAWAMHLSSGNYKHPQLGAWLMRGALDVMPTAFSAVVTLSAACLLTMYVYLYRLGRCFMSAERTFFALLMTSTLYYFNSRSLQFNQNILMLPMWAAMGFYLYQSLKKNLCRDWILLGVVTALAMLAKYESLVFIIICLVYLFTHYKKSYTKYFLLSVMIVLLLLLPNIIWFFHHGFLPLKYVNGRSDTSGLGWATSHIATPFRYLMAQLPLLLYPSVIAILISFKCRVSEVSTKCFMLSLALGPFVLVLLISAVFGMRIPTEWSYPFYIFTTLAAVNVFRWDVTKVRLQLAIGIVIAIHLAIFNYYVFSMHNKKTISALNKPAAAIAHDALQAWQQQVPHHPLRLVVGENYFLGLIPAFTPARPVALLQYSFQDTPYVSPIEAAKWGAIDIVYDCPRGAPARLKRLFPKNKISDIRCFTAKTVNTWHPQDFAFGVYIIFPKD